MRSKARSQSYVTRRKNDRLLVVAAHQSSQRLAGGQWHKVVQLCDYIKQRTFDRLEFDWIAAQRKLTAHESVLLKNFDDNFAKESTGEWNVAPDPLQKSIKGL